MRYKAAVCLSVFSYVLGFSLTPDELGNRATTMNLKELYDAKDTVLYYEELSDSSFAKWLPIERIVESRIDSLVKIHSPEFAKTIMPASDSNFESNFTFKYSGTYVDLGYASASVSGLSGFAGMDMGVLFKMYNKFYLSPHFIYDWISFSSSGYRGADLLVPGVEARYYPIINGATRLYVGPSIGYGLYYGDLGNGLPGNGTFLKANSPQLGVLIGFQSKLFRRSIIGFEAGYNYIPIRVTYSTPFTTNFGGGFIMVTWESR